MRTKPCAAPMATVRARPTICSRSGSFSEGKLASIQGEAAPFFPGFKSHSVDCLGTSIHAVVGGDGPPLLLLHGAPQSHIMWREIALGLAERFTVVASDLRGYGLSAKPPGGIDHSAYSKRAMAADQVELMRKLGFDKYCLAGHDRGARVSRRLAKDHPDKVLQLALLDIVPTAYIYSNVTRQVATNLWHWFFFIQPAPLPELAIGPNAEVWVKWMARLLKAPSEIEETYVNAIRDPNAFSAMCEDYRAGASIDLEHDASDAGKLIGCPTLILWGSKSWTTSALFDVPAAWQNEAVNVEFKAIECGHFLPEENPIETLSALNAFFKS
jgi:haloacetate dehalogenase